MDLTPFKELMQNRPAQPELPAEEGLTRDFNPLHPSFRDVLLAKPITADMLDAYDDNPNNQVKAREIELDDLGLDLNSAKVDEICRLIRTTGIDRAAAARRVGLSPKQLSTWLADATNPPSEHPLVEARRRHMLIIRQRIMQTEAELEASLSTELLISATEAHNVESAKWLLERRFRKGWGKQTEVKHQGKVEHDHRLKDARATVRPNQLSSDDLRTLQDIMLRSKELPAGTQTPMLTVDAELAED